MLLNNIFRGLFNKTTTPLPLLSGVRVQLGLKVKFSVRGGVNFITFDDEIKNAKNLVNFISPIKNAEIRKIYFYESLYNHLKKKNLSMCLFVFSEFRGYKRLRMFIEELLKLRALNLLFRKNLDLFSMGVINVQVVNTYVEIRVQNFHFLKFFYSNLDIENIFNRTFFVYMFTNSKDEAVILCNFLQKLLF